MHRKASYPLEDAAAKQANVCCTEGAKVTEIQRTEVDMALIAWDASFHINIDFVDRQNKMMALVINELYDAIASGSHKNVLKELISRLRIFAAMHFAKEERFFVSSGIPMLRTTKGNIPSLSRRFGPLTILLKKTGQHYQSKQLDF